MAGEPRQRAAATAHRNQTGTQNFKCWPPLSGSVLPAPDAGLPSAQRGLYQRTHTWSTEWGKEDCTLSHRSLASALLLLFCTLTKELFKRGTEREQNKTKQVHGNLFIDNGSRTG